MFHATTSTRTFDTTREIEGQWLEVEDRPFSMSVYPTFPHSNLWAFFYHPRFVLPLTTEQRCHVLTGSENGTTRMEIRSEHARIFI